MATTGNEPNPANWLPEDELAWTQTWSEGITVTRLNPMTLKEHFTHCFPADSCPRYLVDLGADFRDFIPGKDPNKNPKAPELLQWHVTELQSLVNDEDAAKELIVHGWAALSYAWGDYMLDQTKRAVFTGDRKADGLPLAVGDSYDDKARSIRPKNDYDWFIPKCDKLKVIDIKKVCIGLERRFVWWDWACVPQQDLSDGYKGLRSPNVDQNPPPLPEKVRAGSWEEVDKQKFVYQKASVGGVWLHTVDWNASQVSPIKKLLLMCPPGIDFTTIKGVFQDGTEGTAKLVWKNLLDNTLFSGAAGIKAKLEELKATLTAIRPPIAKSVPSKAGEFSPEDGDGWFRSLWSFQEGRLLNDPVLLDKNGKTLPVLNVDTTKYAANFRHLCAIPTFLASQISLALATATSEKIVSNAIFKQSEKVSPKLVALAKSDRDYLVDLLRYLTSSGLVADPEDSPLQLLAAARRTRFPSLRPQDNYYAMVGVLDIFDRVKLADDKDYSITDYKIIQRNFFEALIVRYQWQMLLLAKFVTDPVSSWRAVSLGHFEPIEPFFEAFLGKPINSKAQQQSLTAQPLPLLKYDKIMDEVVITPAATKKSLTIWKWAVPTNYDPAKSFTLTGIPNTTYSLMTNDFQKLLAEGWVDIETDPKTNPPKPILSKKVQSASLASFSGADKWLLVPFQDFNFLFSAAADSAPAGVTTAPPTTNNCSRCLVMAGVTGDKGVFKGTFQYIMDIANAPVTISEATEIRVKWQ